MDTVGPEFRASQLFPLSREASSSENTDDVRVPVKPGAAPAESCARSLHLQLLPRVVTAPSTSPISGVPSFFV